MAKCLRTTRRLLLNHGGPEDTRIHFEVPENPTKNETQEPGTLRLCLHYAASHLWSLVVYAFHFALLFAAAGLIYIVFRDDLPVPGFLARQIEAQLAARGIDASFGETHLDPKGRILVHDLELAPRRFGEPVFAAEIALVELDRFQLLAGIAELAGLRAENVRIICPPALSPSGVSETVLEIAGLNLSTNGERWTVDHLAAEVGPLHISARGTIRVPSPTEQTAPLDLNKVFDTYAKLAPQIARIRTQLSDATDPRLEIGFEGELNRTVAVNTTLTASAWHGIPKVEARGIMVSANATLAPDERPHIEVHAGVRSLTHEDFGVARKVEGFARWDDIPNLQNPWPAELSLNAARLSHPKQDLIAPAIVAKHIAWPRVELALHASLEGEALAITLNADAEKRSGTAMIEGGFGKNWLPRASEILGRDVTYYATIEEPPDFVARIDIDPGLKWKRVNFTATSGPVTARGVAVDRARGRGTVTPEMVRVHQFEFSRGDYSATGTYQDNLGTREYRLHLAGSARPLSISPWFSGWWENFWHDFDFPGTPPWFAIDVHGNWLDPRGYSVLGSARARAGAFRSIEYEAVTTKFFIKPDYYDIHDGSLLRTEGRLDGEVQLAYESGNPIPVRQSFDFESTADLVELAEIFGQGGHEMLAPYRYTIPPRANVVGTVTNKDGVLNTDLAIRIDSENEFRYHDFPLETISTDVMINNNHVELPTVRATYAGGRLNASAVVDEGKLTFFGTLADANFADSIGIFSEFLDRTSPPPADAKPAADQDDSLAAGLEGGRLNLQMSASGNVEDFQSYEGTGTMRITEAELGKVKLFGLLADVLGSIGLNVGVLNFHTAESSIEVKREHLIFPDMRITGDTGALEPKGEYNLSTESLDFRARLYPLRASSGALTQIFGVMLDPFSNFFEVRLTGSLAQPRWTPTLSAIELIKRLTAPPPEESETAPQGETNDTTAPPQDTPPSDSPTSGSDEDPSADSSVIPAPDNVAPPPDQG